MHNFKELNIWKESVNLVVNLYGITKDFPRSEQFGLISQIRRCSVSIPSNIAEGSGRSDADFKRFLSISISSAFELETQLIIANRLEYIADKDLKFLLDSLKSIQKMIYSLKEKVNLDNN